MGNCLSRPEHAVPPQGNPARFKTSTNPRRLDDYEGPVSCSQCQRPCDHTKGRFYLRCLQCPNDFNICDRCFVKSYYHPVHLYAYVDNEERHRFMQRIAKRREGWPILNPVPFVERCSPHTLKCFNLLTADDNGQLKKCTNPVSWICLLCPIAFSLCHSCMALPSQHKRHVFAMANNDNLHNFFMAQLHSGALPLTYLSRTDE